MKVDSHNSDLCVEDNRPRVKTHIELSSSLAPTTSEATRNSHTLAWCRRELMGTAVSGSVRMQKHAKTRDFKNMKSNKTKV